MEHFGLQESFKSHRVHLGWTQADAEAGGQAVRVAAFANCLQTKTCMSIAPSCVLLPFVCCALELYLSTLGSSQTLGGDESASKQKSERPDAELASNGSFLLKSVELG